MINKTYILNLETTTKNCSVSLACDGKLVALKELNNGQYSHAEYLNPFIDDVLKEAGINFADLKAIAVSKGPGSYTGLRIGVSTAKGLCYALNIPLVAVDTLEIVARQLSIKEGQIVSVLDARRMEVYQAIFDTDYQCIEKTKAVVVTSEVYLEKLEKNKLHFVGNATDKMREVLAHKHAVFYPQSSPSARDMVTISYTKFKQSQFEDVAYFEPFYLKDFIAVKKK